MQAVMDCLFLKRRTRSILSNGVGLLSPWLPQHHRVTESKELYAKLTTHIIAGRNVRYL